jgi:nitrogen fixation NifU-like protein
MLNFRSATCASARLLYTPLVFTEALLGHFRNPHNVGDLTDATATVEVTNPICGDVLRLSARMQNGRIAEAKFKAQGCTAAIASSSVLTDLLIGKSALEARAISPDAISQALGGLPPATFHAAQLCVDAVAALIRKLG